jgi:hypothetical protein
VTRRKKCKWCQEILPRIAFDSKEARFGSKPGAYCRECVALMDALRAGTRARAELEKRGNK